MTGQGQEQTVADTESKLRSYLKRVTEDLQAANRRLREYEERAQEPVAIVAMACRFPGGADSPEKLWDLLAEGREALSPWPADRGWDHGLYDPDPDRAGHSYTTWGSFLEQPAGFDAAFFGISPREAIAMDPQQRLLLELTWETFERAGIDPLSLPGRAGGVFVGASNQGYAGGYVAAPPDLEGHLLTGSSSAVLSGRIAYTLGLRGPAVTVDTMCSSSLVAVHLAIGALRSGDCEFALACGATVMANPRNFVEFSRQGGLAADGRCKAFGAGADGTGWGEGAGVLLLERLADARRNGRRVLAVVAGSAVNQDGASNGLTAPNGPSQQAVIAAALASAGVGPGDVDVVEAHGTGTRLGDPIEAGALIAAYGRHRAGDRPLWVGSVKSNIGHTQAAAGMAGVMKAVLAMRHGVVPASLHAGVPSGEVDWDAGVKVASTAMPWPDRADDGPRRAGVSAFGGSGTNAHVIVEATSEEPEPDPRPEAAPEESAGPVVWVVSGRGAGGLAGQAGRLAAWAGAGGAGAGVRDVDVAWSLGARRAGLSHRAAVVGSSRGELAAGLASIAAGEGVVRGEVTAGDGRVVLVFPGQGAQWPGMGAGLLSWCPAFAARLAECDAALAPLTGWSVREVLEAGEPLDRVEVVQPVSWAVMVALAAAWRWLGVKPAAVAGHSQGEVAAAVVAGALSVGDGARVVWARSRAVAGSLAGRGAMASVAVGEDRAAELAARHGVVVAAVNSPSSVVVSGDPDAVAGLAAWCEGAGVRARVLPVDYASHSPQVAELEAGLAAALAGITPREPEILMWSTVTGGWVAGGELGAGYWYRNLRCPVRFAAAVTGLAGAGFTRFVEASAHPVLTGAVTETAEAAAIPVAVTGTLRRGEDTPARLLTSAAHWWATGGTLDFTALYPNARPADLPTYAFQHHNYWLPPSTATTTGPATADQDTAGFWRAVDAADTGALASALDLPPETLHPVLPALATWRHRQETAAALRRWRYRVTWHRAADQEAAPLSGTWLIVRSSAADGILAQACRDAILAAGGEAAVMTVDSADDRRRIGERLRHQLAAGPVAGVMSLLGTDERPHARCPAIPAGLMATLDFLQALGDAEVLVPAWLVTHGAVAVDRGDGPAHPLQAAIWGLGRVFGLEQPERWGGLIDLPADGAELAARELGRALAGQGAEDQLAIRANGTWLRRLIRDPFADEIAPPWRTSGTALVTGGTGGLGAHAARWLSERGAEHLVLVSRSGLAAAGASELAGDLTEAGVRVSVRSCDVSDREQISALVASLREQGEQIRTVVHTAGVGMLAALASTSPEEFADGARAKLAGARHLDELFGEDDLDAFVMYTSVAGVWGTGDHGSYAAANAFADALAESRRCRGLAATSIAWGIWDGAGMVSDVIADQLAWRGIPFMAPGVAMTGLAQALDHGETSAVIADIDWTRFVPVFTAARPRPFLTTVPEVAAILQAEEGKDDDAERPSALRRQLSALAGEDRERELVSLVRSLAASVLGYGGPHDVAATRAFREVGFDSLTALDFRNRLSSATGLKLPAAVVFDYPNAAALGGYLLTRIFGDAPQSPPAASPTVVAGDRLAIVGMACRFPGGVSSPAELWELLSAGADVITEFPADRDWPLARLYDADPDHPGTSYTRHGGFLPDAALFDPGFFGISPREALAMDPQQRLLLETSWEALENAGLSQASLRGSRTGVFVGASGHDYGARLREVPEDVEAHLVTGGTASVTSGRISYAFGLEGPAVTIDTGCSSSLVAMHLARQALTAGECDLALAAGVAVMSTPGPFVSFSRQRALAADGRCKAFSDDADGMGLSEGTAVLVLERHADAQRNGHAVLGLVTGSAVNQDGASNGLTAPNGLSQQAVIGAALAGAGLGPADVDVVEAHGTGTRLGDPIEAGALVSVYGRERPEERPLWIGSVKSNLGHTQAAAGIAGVIKTLLAMRHGVVPASLHADVLSREVDWNAGVRVATRAMPWPDRADGGPRRAGVSAFGVSGTNAHLILEAPPVPEPSPGPASRPAAENAPPGPPVMWVVSGRGEQGLASQAARLTAWARGAGAGADPADVGWSLGRRRPELSHRAAAVGRDAGEIVAGLERLAAGLAGADVVRGEVTAVEGRPVLVFPGQGTQWPGMAAELLESCPAFAERFAECATALAPLTEWPAREILLSGDLLERVDVVQPLSWAVMVALAEAWRWLGVVPAAVVGHSQGEVAAAVVAGALSVSDGARVVTARSRLIAASLSGQGAMASVGLSEAEVTELIGRRSGQLVIAVVNSPSLTVVSGPPGEIGELVAWCRGQGIRARALPVDYASHSPAVAELASELDAELAGLRPRPPECGFFSTVKGEWVTGTELGAAYWFDNLRRPVRFADAITTLARSGYTRFVEASTHPVLTGAVTETAEALGIPVAVTGTLRRDEGGMARLLTSAAAWWVTGGNLDFGAMFPGAGPADLPTYCFQRQRYWLASGADAPASQAAADPETARFWQAVEAADADALAGALDLSPEAVGPFLPALATWRTRARERQSVSSWRYRTDWIPVSGRTGPCQGHWLVLTPPWLDGVIAGRIAGQVHGRVLTVPAGATRPELAAALTAGPALAGVLSLLAIGEPGAGSPEQAAGFALNLALIQARADVTGGAALWLATQGAVSVSDAEEPGSPEQALTWGAGRIAAQEYPEIPGGIVDLPAELDQRSLTLLESALAGRGDEFQLAVRPSGLYARRLVRAPFPGQAPAPWRPAGTVLVTGGTGGVGRHLARWLAAGGARRLVLVSRRGPAAPGARELAGELMAAGTEVLLAACDVGDREQLSGLLSSLPDLTAVVHAAAVLDDGLIGSLTPERAAAVLRPKAAAAWHLHELTADRALSAFILFSSLAGTIGGAGQASYAAASSYLDALARTRRRAGLPATSVAWGSWGGGGLTGGETGERLAALGLPPMEPALALAALQQALDRDEAVVAVADIRWDSYRRMLARGRTDPSLLGLPEFSARPAAAPAKENGTWRSELGELPAGTRKRRVSELVTGAAAAVLGYDAAAAIEPRRAFRDLGLDSVTALDLRNRLADATRLRLPVTLAFDYPSAEALTEHLLSELGDASQEAARPTFPAGAGPDEPVAIVALSCRYPGGASSPEDLWDLLEQGRDAVAGFPDDRGWDMDRRYDPDPGQVGTCYASGGAFLYDAADFDAGLFGLSPREALATDPQQRLLLELAWEACERAGIAPLSLRGFPAGVFVGSNYHDYGSRFRRAPDGLEGHLALGSAGSVLSGRLAYVLGLEGPAVTVDTACSSSLVALHLAVQSLRSGECDLALAGGVTVMASPTAFVEFSRQRALSPDGRCKAFSDDADGTGWGEGAGLVMLERLSDARRNGHQVLGVVLGSAVNSDGASNGLTAPNGPSQQRVIRAALASAGLTAADVDAVEAHGTGTRLGDPIEAQALLATYGQDRRGRGPLYLGSVKSNLGHTQAAAGIAGVIKMVLALQHQSLPRTLHVTRPSSHVDWQEGAIELLREPVPWPPGDRPRRAGVSAFGVSGTNAHVIVAEPPPAVPERAAAEETAVTPSAGGTSVAWPVSGASREALGEVALRLAAHAAEHPELSSRDIGRALAAGRSPLAHRAVVVAEDRAGLLAGLEAVGSGRPAATVVSGSAVTGPAGTGLTAFVFSGQGSQRAGMGAGLYRAFGVFAEALDETCAVIDPLVGQPLRELMFAEGDALGQTGLAQPALFAVQVALARLLGSWGIVPDYVAGHSVGEIAAAHLAGVLSLADGARLAAERGRLMQGLPGGGAMAAVGAGVEVVEGLLAGCGEVCVAAVNSPVSVVVSGAEEAVAAVCGRASAAGLRVRRLAVSHAFHSPLMEPVLGELAGVAGGLGFGAARCGVVSSVTGAEAGEAMAGPGYWVEQVRRPVLFGAAVQTLAGLGVSRFAEIGPAAALTPMISEIFDQLDAGGRGRNTLVVPALADGQPEAAAVLTAAARLHVAGAEVDWGALYPGAGPLAALPTYPFQRQRYWLEGDASDTDLAAAGLSGAGHPLLGAAVPVAGGGQVLLTGRLSLRSHPWLAGHEVFGSVLLPGAAFAELAVRAADEAGCEQVTELTLAAPLVLPPDSAVDIQVGVGEPGEDGLRSLTIHARPAGAGSEWALHATGAVGPGRRTASMPLREWPPPGAAELPVGDFYDVYAAGGLAYRDAFRGLTAAWRDADGAVYADVRLPEQATEGTAGFCLHPALLDAALQAMIFVPMEGSGRTRLPFSFTGITVHAGNATAARVRLTASGRDALAVTIADSAGRLVAEIESLAMREVTADHVRRGQHGAGALFALDLTPLTTEPLSADAGSWAVIGSGDGALTAAAGGTRAYQDLDELAAAVARGEPPPDVVLAPCPAAGPGHADAAHALARWGLDVIQRWLGAGQLGQSRLVFLTSESGGRAGGPGVPGLPGAPLWGLVRSAQAEHPGRFTLIGLDGRESSYLALAAAVASGEPQLMVRDGTIGLPRLVRAGRSLSPPPGERDWRLESTESGTLASLALVPSGTARTPLADGEVRVMIRAAGVNFRDVLTALGMYPGPAGPLGLEGAGVVTEIGPRVTRFAAGDRVTGLIPAAFARMAITDERLLARVPDGWSYAEAAAMPVVFLTAYYALADLARVRPGDSVLVHAAAGGVGMAAVQLARHLGAEVFGTASPAKWDTLRALGLPDDRIASSRDPGFDAALLRATGGRGVDVVLNSLAGEFIDASLRLMPRGGRFLEIGKTDRRDPAAVAERYPGVSYRAIDLIEAGPERITEMLTVILGLFAEGALRPLPRTAWDVRRAPDAFRCLQQARHVGKVILTVPPPLDRDGTVLVTGGTGGLGGAVARHLVSSHGARNLLLISRAGPGAAAASALREDLSALGAMVTIAKADVADRDSLAAVLAGIPPEHPLTAVVHTAGMVDDGLTEALDPSRLAPVLRPKIDGAVHLDELTQDADLAAFVLFSAAAGLLGGAGQGSYAAANAFTDAFAAHLAASGRPVTSLAWGPWESSAGMTSRLRETDRARMNRAGLRALSVPAGLALLDQALESGEPVLAPMSVDTTAMARSGSVPLLFRALVTSTRPPASGPALAAPDTWAQRIAGLTREQADETLTSELCEQVALVLGYAAGIGVDPGRTFNDLGFDSLTAVELRNRLSALIGIRLPATLVFDYPTIPELAACLRSELAPGAPERRPDASLTPDADGLAQASADELMKLIDEEFGS
jgi:acyl transferase domain-containing protein/D-arabinose 1-dehydrogenase-like Zn-dependent alcohol dehydrogenase/acyl carrier protein